MKEDQKLLILAPFRESAGECLKMVVDSQEGYAEVKEIF